VDNTTMLALDDGALARICIAATSLRRRRRQRWLKDLAERIDPTPRRVMRAKAKGGQPHQRKPTGLRKNPVYEQCCSDQLNPQPKADIRAAAKRLPSHAFVRSRIEPAGMSASLRSLPNLYR
jgi:hypothetical protein